MATINDKLRNDYQEEMDLINKTKKGLVVKPTKTNTGLPNNTVGITSGMVGNKATTTQKNTSVNTSVNKSSSVVDTSAYDRSWGQNQAQYNLQLGQLDQSYQLALSQLSEQEKEEESQTGRLAQQSYIAKKQAEKVLPNQLEMMGVANTGYENVARENIQNQFNNSYEQYMYNLGLAKAAIKRARESQTMNYNQNKASIQLNQQQAYDDYQYSKQQASIKQSQSNSSSVVSKTKPNIDTVIKTALSYGSADRSVDYLKSMVEQKVISREEANRIYNEYGQYWSYYNQ